MEKRVYAKGCKSFLANLEPGKETEIPGHFKYCSVKSIASRMCYDFGIRIVCKTVGEKKYVKLLS